MQPDASAWRRGRRRCRGSQDPRFSDQKGYNSPTSPGQHGLVQLLQHGKSLKLERGWLVKAPLEPHGSALLSPIQKLTPVLQTSGTSAAICKPGGKNWNGTSNN